LSAQIDFSTAVAAFSQGNEAADAVSAPDRASADTAAYFKIRILVHSA
jgi:hypothetical protein